jgi:death-on-curing protein
MIPISEVILTNKDITGDGKVLSPHLLESAFSSWHYYDTEELQAVSIYRGLVKNHAFKDGNKRIAYVIFSYLCSKLKLPIRKSDDEMIDITLKVANGNLTVEQITNIIFGVL